jgi:uroporphyrinogen-III decarboxylase
MTETLRQRFLDICRFKRTGDLCLLAPWLNDFWMETPDVWVSQGAPAELADPRTIRSYFEFDHIRVLREIQTGLFMDKRLEVLGMNYVYAIPPILPTYEIRMLGEDEHTLSLTNEGGQVVRIDKRDPQKMPMYLDHPVKDRATWQEYKKRLDPRTPERFPADWQAYVARMNAKEEPLLLNVGSFFGFLREWMGLEPLLYAFHDEPALIEDMMDTLCDLETTCITEALKDIRVDAAMFWEDMAFKTGPLISPKMFRQFMMPRYKVITDLLRSKGVDIIFVDSDGGLNQLIPLWIESGINFFWPLECAAGNDAVALRKKYGKDAILGGNIDKRALLKSKDVIREEVMSKVPYLLETGGYFPSVDHFVPPDVPFENYVYLIDTLREVAGLPPLKPFARA